VLNNPLSYTDPSGFFFQGLFKAIGNFFGNLFKGIGNILKQALKSGILRSLLTLAGCAFAPVACPAISAVVTLATGGSIGDALKAFAFAWASAGIWEFVGTALEGARAALGAAWGAAKMLVHGVVGGALSVAQGGSFLQGFASNALGALGGIAGESVFGPAGEGDSGAKLGRTLMAAAAGCAASSITGGKCAEGALTAGFAHLFNAEKGQKRDIFVEALDAIAHFAKVELTVAWLEKNGYRVRTEVRLLDGGEGYARADIMYMARPNCNCTDLGIGRFGIIDVKTPQEPDLTARQERVYSPL
jgi:hypothetical protein